MKILNISNTFIGCWTRTGGLTSSLIGELSLSSLKASFLWCQHFLSYRIHQDRSLHLYPPFLSCVSHPIRLEQMKGKPWCVWGCLAAEPEVERWDEQERGDEGEVKGREKTCRGEKAQPALTLIAVRREEFVLEGGLVSIRTPLEGNWKKNNQSLAIV